MKHKHAVLFSSLFLLLLLSPVDLVQGGDAKPNAEATALMRKVEAARLKTEPFQLKGRFSRRILLGPFKDRQVEIDLEIDYEAGKYRIRAKGDESTTSIFDGTQLLSYEVNGSALITSVEQDRVLLAFDPRTLGISPSLRADTNLQTRLAFVDGTDLVIKGTEDISNFRTTIVGVTDRYKQSVQFWIDPAKPYRVLKYSFDVPNSGRGGVMYRTVSESKFWVGGNEEWIPYKIRTTTYQEGDEAKVAAEETLTFNRPIRPVQFSPDVWTLKGLGLPKGEPVVDLRIKMRIGYWDGEKPVENLPRTK